jgi:hypothetical protein
VTTAVAHPDLELMLSDDVDRKCDLRRLSPDKQRWVNCENPAAWIFRLRLQCGHRPKTRTILVCQECCDSVLGEVPADKQPMILCPAQKCTSAAKILSVEPL